MVSDRAAQIIETHISTLFFSEERVYKLAKKIDLPFFHAVDTQDRLRLPERELELNRRFAPDVYLGVADVTENDEVVDRLLVMRRLPAGRRLSALLHNSEAPELLHHVARRIAAVHAAEVPALLDPSTHADRIERNWQNNFEVLHDHVGSVVDRAEFDAVHHLAGKYLAQCRSLFERRATQGFVRDGHGDLTADDIFCLADGPRILDCLAFDDDLRIGDVLNDIAFLAMDVHRLAGRRLSALLMRSYHEFSNEHHPSSLAHHYVAYRAHVRAKVACLRAAQGDRDSVDLARQYHAIALDHLERAEIRAIVIGGGPGVGKTLLSKRLGDHYGFVHLATDVIRHDVAQIPHGHHAFAAPDTGAYDPAVIDATYDEQRRELGALLDGGHGVVLDASWASERHRQQLRQAVSDRGVDLIEIECVLDDDTARNRIANRLADSDDPSDATPDLVAYLRGRRDAWPSAHRLSTARPIDDLVLAAVELIGGERS